MNQINQQLNELASKNSLTDVTDETLPLANQVGELIGLIRSIAAEVDQLQFEVRQIREASSNKRNTVKSFDELRERNVHRCEAPHGFSHPLESWSLSDWMTATAGELGEAANIVKKMNRHRDGVHEPIPLHELREMLADEIADTAIYLDLLAAAANIDLGDAIERKFEATSKKIGYVQT